jgi:hypothetical protein
LALRGMLLPDFFRRCLAFQPGMQTHFSEVQNILFIQWEHRDSEIYQPGQFVVVNLLTNIQSVNKYMLQRSVVDRWIQCDYILLIHPCPEALPFGTKGHKSFREDA